MTIAVDLGRKATNKQTMMATCILSEHFIFKRLMIGIVTDWLMTIADYSELVADLSRIDCRLNAKHSPNVRRLVCD